MNQKIFQEIDKAFEVYKNAILKLQMCISKNTGDIEDLQKRLERLEKSK